MSKLLTRRGVTFDFENTPYVCKVKYGNETYNYKFSSKTYLDKFIMKHQSNRDEINYSLSNRFNIHIKLDVLADIKLYSTIEKRGFLIANQDRRFNCLNNIVLDGQSLTIKNLQE